MTITPMKEPVRIEHADGVTVYQRRTYLLKWEDLGVKRHDLKGYTYMSAIGTNLDMPPAKLKELRDWLDTSCKFNTVGSIGITFSDVDDAVKCKLTWAGMLVSE